MVKTTDVIRIKNGKYRVISARCGTKQPKQKCPALEQKCQRCGNLNHYQSLSARSSLLPCVGEEDSDEDESYEICTVDEESLPSVNKAFVEIFVSTKKAKATKKLGNQVRFQVDTGSECNLPPIKL